MLKLGITILLQHGYIFSSLLFSFKFLERSDTLQEALQFVRVLIYKIPTIDDAGALRRDKASLRLHGLRRVLAPTSQTFRNALRPWIVVSVTVFSSLVWHIAMGKSVVQGVLPNV
jgi:uncharacterized membrane protein YccC